MELPVLHTDPNSENCSIIHSFTQTPNLSSFFTSISKIYGCLYSKSFLLISITLYCLYLVWIKVFPSPGISLFAGSSSLYTAPEGFFEMERGCVWCPIESLSALLPSGAQSHQPVLPHKDLLEVNPCLSSIVLATLLPICILKSCTSLISSKTSGISQNSPCPLVPPHLCTK